MKLVSAGTPKPTRETRALPGREDVTGSRAGDTVREMEGTNWALLSDHELLERRISDADTLRAADQTADQAFQILDQIEGDGTAKAR